MNSTNSFFEFKEVSKKYKDTIALDKISFDVLQGEIFGYIGPNGAGKTTTIKILTGLIREFNGEYQFQSNTSVKNYESIQKISGYLPQGVTFQEWRTVDHVLKTFGKLSGLHGDSLEQKIKQVLELMDLSGVRNKKVAKLSGGMVQKLGFAQALLNDPEFLVLDEPLSGLDPASRYEVKNIIRSLSKKGTTVFFSSHILSDVQDIADRIALLDKGQILKIGKTSELTSDLYSEYIIEVLFFNDFENLALIKSIKGINKLDQQSSRKLLIIIDKKADLETLSFEILNKFVAHKCHLKSFSRITPNLDEVYLKYIKRKDEF